MLLATFQPDIESVGGSLTASALVAALPLVTLFVLLGGLRITAWISGLVALGVALVVAVGAFSMPVDQAVLAATEGAAFGFFPIMWIVINAIWVYNLTVDDRALRRAAPVVRGGQRRPAGPGDHHRVLLRRAAGGAGRLRHAGRHHRRHADRARLPADQGRGRRPGRQHRAGRVRRARDADRHPVTVTSGVTTTRASPSTISAPWSAGRPRCSPLFVPLVLVFIVDGKRGIRQTWLPALVCGVAFGVAQFVAANYISVPLTDIVAALWSAAAPSSCCCGCGRPVEPLRPSRRRGRGPTHGGAARHRRRRHGDGDRPPVRGRPRPSRPPAA